MALITSNIPNLINGVSQQPPTLRLASQAERQSNYMSSVADGLVDRPPTQTLARLATTRWDDTFLHTINRDLSERYVVAVDGSEIKIFDAETGNQRTVDIQAPAYLTAGSPGAADWRAVTVADYTFLLNTKVQTAMKADLSPARNSDYLISVNAGNYGRTYRIIINNQILANTDTPNGSDPSHTAQVDTVKIAEALNNDWNSKGGAAAGYTLTRQSNTIRIHRADGAAFALRVDDGANGNNMKAFGAQTQRFSDLPANGWVGFSTEIVGDNTSSFDNYYVQYQSTTGNQSVDAAGVWKEVMKGGEKYKFDPATMPHVLVRESNGTFTFKQATWDDREVGDLEKMAVSFVGRPLRDIFFFQNRLGVCSDEQVIMSQDGEFFNFWRSTATSLLDTDPIDNGIATEQVSIINYAVPFQRSLLLFSDQAQFTLDAGDYLSPKSVSVGQATSFESTRGVRPTNVGPYMYFPVPRGGHTGLREYFVQDNDTGNDARDITSHVPRYVPKNVFNMTASSAEETLVLLSKETPESMWVYRFFNSDEGKLQSAWSEWKFEAGCNIVSATFIESSLYFVVTRPAGTFLEVMNLESGSVAAGSSLMFLIDRQFQYSAMTPTFNDATQETEWPTPWVLDGDGWMAVVRGDDTNFPEGYDLPVRYENQKLYLRGKWDDKDLRFIMGKRYMREYQFSTFFIRETESGGGVSADSAGRLQLKRLYIDYDRTSYFSVKVETPGRDPSMTVFSGRTLGTQSGSVGQLNRATGRASVPVLARNTDAKITIMTDSHLPSGFTSAEWEANFTIRAMKR